MIVKAGLIVAVFMHMAWERLALMYAILVPPGAVLLLVAIMVAEIELHALHAGQFFRSERREHSNYSAAIRHDGRHNETTGYRGRGNRVPLATIHKRDCAATDYHR